MSVRRPRYPPPLSLTGVNGDLSNFVKKSTHACTSAVSGTVHDGLAVSGISNAARGFNRTVSSAHFPGCRERSTSTEQTTLQSPRRRRPPTHEPCPARLFLTQIPLSFASPSPSPTSPAADLGVSLAPQINSSWG